MLMSMLRVSLFYLRQFIWKLTQKCCLATRYKDECSVLTLVKGAALLPLVPDNQVEDVCFSVLNENEDDSTAITRFTHYVTETWVEG